MDDIIRQGYGLGASIGMSVYVYEAAVWLMQSVWGDVAREEPIESKPAQVVLVILRLKVRWVAFWYLQFPSLSSEFLFPYLLGESKLYQWEALCTYCLPSLSHSPVSNISFSFYFFFILGRWVIIKVIHLGRSVQWLCIWVMEWERESYEKLCLLGSRVRMPCALDFE